MQPLVNVAVSAARSAGNAIVRHLNLLDRIDVKSKGRNDFVSEVDRLAEAEIIGTIRHAHPDHAFLAEESGATGDSDFVWIIDPLDGTTNFLHGFPVFAVSIAMTHRGRLELGVIYDPLRQELFTASRGEGAQLDGRRIRVSHASRLEGSLIGTGIPFSEKTLPWIDDYLQQLKAVSKISAGIRRPGSAALDLASVAAGRLDGYWEFGLSPWDLAAGEILVREAGGMVTDMSGGETHRDKGHVVAGNQKVLRELIKVLAPHLPAELRGK